LDVPSLSTTGSLLHAAFRSASICSCRGRLHGSPTVGAGQRAVDTRKNRWGERYGYLFGAVARSGQKKSWSLNNCPFALTGPLMAQITKETGISKELHSGLFLAFPKTYEFRFPNVSIRNCLIAGPLLDHPYLISGWFMGSHWTREGNARRPPSLIYAMQSDGSDIHLLAVRSSS
jgi:hypothetical protein